MVAARKPRSRPARAPRQTRAANAARGEHELTLAGVTYLLRPAHAVQTAIETELGASVTALARDCNTCSLPLSDLAVIVTELIKAGAAEGDRLTATISADRIEELIFEEGQGPVYVRVFLALLDLIGGGRTIKGERKAVATTNRAPATAE